MALSISTTPSLRRVPHTGEVRPVCGLEDAYPTCVTLSDIDAARQLPVLWHPCRAAPVYKADRHVVLVDKNIARRDVAVGEADAIRLFTNPRCNRAHLWISSRGKRHRAGSGTRPIGQRSEGSPRIQCVIRKLSKGLPMNPRCAADVYRSIDHDIIHRS